MNDAYCLPPLFLFITSSSLGGRKERITGGRKERITEKQITTFTS